LSLRFCALASNDGNGFDRVDHSKSAETFYWVTIMFSQTLGTAAGRLDGRFDRGLAMPAALWCLPPGSLS